MKKLASVAFAALISTSVSAQTPATDAPPQAKGPVLITLGTAGGPLPRRERAQSSNLLVVNGTPYLIDAGDGATRRIVQAGYDFRQVGKVFITHAHSDHTNGLATLLNAQWEYQRREPTDVYGSRARALVNRAAAHLTPHAHVPWPQAP